MDTTALTSAGTRLGTIRRHGYTIAIDVEVDEDGARRFPLAAIGPGQDDEPLGAVTVTVEDRLDAQWSSAAGDIGLLDGSAFQSGVHRVLRALAAALNGIPLSTEHGVRLHPDWEYRLPIIEAREAV